MTKDIPAFPGMYLSNNDGIITQEWQEGMSLRDYFAAKALNGMLSAAPFKESVTYGMIARAAYEYADAMLAARDE